MSHVASYNTTDTSESNVIVSTLQTGLTITGTSFLSGTASLVPLAAGQEIVLSYAGYTQTWIISGTAGTGTTSIPVYTQTPSYAFPAGTLITAYASVQSPLLANEILTIGPIQTDVAQQLTGSLFTDQSGSLSIQQSFDAYNPHEPTTLLTTAISPTAAVTSLAVEPLTAPITAPTTAVLSYGPGGAPQNIYVQSFTISGNVAVGATSLPVISQTPQDFFPSGTSISVMGFDVQNTVTATVLTGGTAQPFEFSQTILAPWLQIVYTNGSTAQGVFKLFARTFFQGR